MSIATTDVEQLRRRAGTLRRSAFQVELAELWALRRRAGDDVWVGPAAGEFLDDLAIAEAHLRNAYDELRAAARRLDREADSLEAAGRAALGGPS